MAPVYFGFDESSLSGDATGIVASNVECLKKAPDRAVSRRHVSWSRETPRVRIRALSHLLDRDVHLVRPGEDSSDAPEVREIGSTEL